MSLHLSDVQRQFLSVKLLTSPSFLRTKERRHKNIVLESINQIGRAILSTYFVSLYYEGLGFHYRLSHFSSLVQLVGVINIVRHLETILVLSLITALYLLCSGATFPEHSNSINNTRTFGPVPNKWIINFSQLSILYCHLVLEGASDV